MSRKNHNVSSALIVERVRVVAATENDLLVSYGKHALERMKQRKITPIQVLRILRSRFRIHEEPHQGAAGEWLLTIEGNDSGELIRIGLKLVELSNNDYLLVLTTIKPSSRKR